MGEKWRHFETFTVRIRKICSISVLYFAKKKKRKKKEVFLFSDLAMVTQRSKTAATTSLPVPKQLYLTCLHRLQGNHCLGHLQGCK